MNRKSMLAGVFVGLFAMQVQADWTPPDPNAKWIQMPQMSGGYDVLSMEGFYPDATPVNKVVADDWLCDDPRPVTDIHVWGSWWNDSPSPDAIPFRLTIYSDVPAGGGNPSHPGISIWTKELFPTVSPWGTGTEQFYDPNGHWDLSPESQVWQYNFFLDPADYFHQVPGTIYWLSVQAVQPPPGTMWGWKTSETHWNDDAAWADLPDLAWTDLHDPAPPNNSLDMAFVLTVPEPQTCTLVAGLSLLMFAAWRRRRG